MELLQLEYFCTVARLEHMTQAAEELRIAQPALSRTIVRLEESLGIPLFDRQGRRIKLNAFGKAFLKRAEEALGALSAGRQEVLDMAGLARGHVRLATTWVERLADPLIVFRDKYPETKFSIVETCADEMGELLDKGEADLCLTAQTPRLQGIQEQDVFREELVLAVPPDHPLADETVVTVSDIEDEPFVAYSVGHPRRALLDIVSLEAGIRPRVVCEVAEPEALLKLVQAGLGIAVVPKTCSSPWASRMRIARLHLAHPAFYLTYKAVWLESHYLSAAAGAFRDFLVQYFADDPVPSEAVRHGRPSILT